MRKFEFAILAVFMLLSSVAQVRERIAFTSNRDGNNEIYVMDTDGKNKRRLTNNEASDSAPAWSPNGQTKDRKPGLQMTLPRAVPSV